MKFNKRAFAAVVAVLLAVGGIGALVVYTNGAQDRAFAGRETVSVLRVTVKVPAGTKASAMIEMVERAKLPRAAVPGDLVTSLDALGTKVTTVNLVPGDVLVGARFAGALDVTQTGEVAVPKGLQELTLQLDPTRVLGGELQPGERVGVLASMTEGSVTNFVVNRVLVIAVGSGVSGDQAQAGSGGVLVRLALDFEDVEKVVNASEFGKVWLARQNGDAKTGRKIVTLGDVVK